MPSDYDAIRKDNERRYGTDIGRIGPLLLANRYDDRTHFIYELLQNAEDALAKRGAWKGPKSINFSLSPEALTVTHFGKPFDKQDVLGICGIGESTKDLTTIGRFGIGFKSVYAFTDSPEIHSGSESFAIDSFVWPRAIAGIHQEQHATVIRLPFRCNDAAAAAQILTGLQRLGSRTLLFLSEIEEISWSMPGGPSGLYLRDKPKEVGYSARKVMIIGQDDADTEAEDENWLVFSRKVFNEGKDVGQVEVAFGLEEGTGGEGTSVRRLTDSPLVAFFPTALSTNLGFLVQGPYQTTPSRDNVPQNEDWNQYLVRETSILLVDALRELRQLGLLNVSALRSLPIDASRFPEGSRFAPLFSAVRETLMKEPLLPHYKNGFVAAQDSKLARTQDLRDLIGPEQLADLFQGDNELAWLSGDITADRTPDIRTYLIEELDVHEITPEWLLPRLTRTFLEAQPDEWTERLYVFLNGQRALLPRLRDMPLIRLEDGSHIIAYVGSQPRAFLPLNDRTGFPTVRRSVCRLEDALAFLKSLGLSPPDPVDDVIANILPKYDDDHLDVSDPDYRADVEQVLAAFATDSTTQRQKLVSALQRVRFVRAVDVGDGSHHFVCPADAYQATQRMKELFAGISGIMIVDDSKNYLRGERIRALLEAAGCPLYLVPIAVKSPLTRAEKVDLRRATGTVAISGEVAVRDNTLRGLEPLLTAIENLGEEELASRTFVLWQALCDVVDRRGMGVFQGEYRWKWYQEREAAFDASFVRMLNETMWVPDENGVLQRPQDVVFEDTGWEANPFLLTKIHFKPPVIDELAREAGIEPGVLTLLTQFGLTSVEQLTSHLRQAGLIDEKGDAEDTPSVEDALREFLGDGPSPTPPVPGPSEPIHASGPVSGTATGEQPSDPAYRPSGGGVTAAAGAVGGGHTTSRNVGAQRGTGQGTHSGGERKFFSYVALTAESEEESDPDSLTQQERFDLEDRAIEFILEHEPGLKRTPTNNPGFDLMDPGPDGQPVKLVEVKAMKGTLRDRPVGLSRTQFECAQEHESVYWLYVVEGAGDPERARVVQIQNPAGRARTFTFDHGWIEVAEQAMVTDLDKSQPDQAG